MTITANRNVIIKHGLHVIWMTESPFHMTRAFNVPPNTSIFELRTFADRVTEGWFYEVAR